MALAGGSSGGSTAPYFTGRQTTIDGTRHEIWTDPTNGTEFLVNMGSSSRENRYDTTGYGQNPMTSSPSRGRSSMGVPAGDYPGTFQTQPDGNIVYTPPAPAVNPPAPSGGGGYSSGYGGGYAPPPAPRVAPMAPIAPPPPPRLPSAQSNAVRQWNAQFGGDNKYQPNQSFSAGTANPVAPMPAMPAIPAPAKPAAPQGVPLITPEGQVFGVLTTNEVGKQVVKRLPKGAPDRWYR